MRGTGLVCLLLFDAIATVFQLYHGGDTMYEMRRRKPESTLLWTQGIFKPPRPYMHGMRATDLVCLFGCLLLFYAIATIPLLYHGSDMMYEMRRKTPERTLLWTQEIFKLPHHILIEAWYESNWP